MKIEFKEFLGNSFTIETSLDEMKFTSELFKSFWDNLTDSEKEKLIAARTIQIEQFLEGSKLILDNFKNLNNQKKEE